MDKQVELANWYKQYSIWLLNAQTQDAMQAQQQCRVFLNDELGHLTNAAGATQPLSANDQWFARFLSESNLQDKWNEFQSQFGQCAELRS